MLLMKAVRFVFTGVFVFFTLLLSLHTHVVLKVLQGKLVITTVYQLIYPIERFGLNVQKSNVS